MGCSSGGCSSGSCGTGGGCSSGCNGCSRFSKLLAFNWLSFQPAGKKAFVEVVFKHSRKEMYINPQGLHLQGGDLVKVDTSMGYDLGMVGLIGDAARLQMKKKKQLSLKDNLPEIISKPNQKEIDLWQQEIKKEDDALKVARRHAHSLRLDMKFSYVEIQADGKKATFFYTAKERVDFRELIKFLGRELKVRIEMRQIGVRMETSRLGGIGSCGRELCCSTWLTDFRTVSTTAARYQQLSMNPQKLAGQCGKLKCCLNFELDTYVEALKKFPSNRKPLFSKKGKAYCQKIDIFSEKLTYNLREEYTTHWYELPLAQVWEIIEANKKGIEPEDLADFVIKKEEIATEDEKGFSNVVGQDSISRYAGDQLVKPAPNRRRKQGKSSFKTKRPPKEGKASSHDEGKQSETTGSNKNRPDSKRKPSRNSRKPRGNWRNKPKKNDSEKT